MTRYVVIGAGAVGALLAAQLHVHGIDVVLVARSQNLARIRSHGLTVRRPATTDVVRVPVVGSSQELTLTGDDVLVLATKAQDAEAALVEWAWSPVIDAVGRPTLLGTDLPILTFQNGLSTEDLALRRFSRVYGVSIGIAASHLRPGEVVSPSFPTVGVAWIGRYPHADEHQRRYAGDLRAAAYDVQSVTDIRAWKARKLLANVANGLDVLAGTDDERTEARARLVSEAEEVFAVAGIALPDALARSRSRATPLTVEPVPGHVGGHLSTWQSFARRTSSEVDHLNGEIVLLARLAGTSAPFNERLQRLLGIEARRGAGPGAVTLSALLDPSTNSSPFERQHA